MTKSKLAMAFLVAACAPSVCWAAGGTVRISCPDSPQDGRGCRVTILTKGGGARNFPLEDGETVRTAANRDDRYCVIPVTAPPSLQCHWGNSHPVREYVDN